MAGETVSRASSIAPASPESNASEEQEPSWETRALIDHIESSHSAVLFFVELSPGSSRGARCRLSSCDKRIVPDDYRVAVHPGASHWSNSADLYHVHCFEKIVDLSQTKFLDRIQPVTRMTIRLRGISTGGMLDGNYLVNGGAERLILSWKVQRRKHIDARDGVDQGEDTMAPALRDLLEKAGKAGFRPQRVEGMSTAEFFRLSHALAPNESDGPDDEDEWNLFEEYLGDDEEHDVNDRHSLSSMLQLWRTDQFLATADETQLSEAGKHAKVELSDKAKRAIKRLSGVHRGF